MSQFYTSTSLIESIKVRAMLPQNQVTFTDDDFLRFANEEISLGLLPSIMRLHEDYLLYTEEVSLVANKSEYTIPHRAIGNKLRELSYKDRNGNIIEMTRIGIEDEPEYIGPYTSNSVKAFYVKNNKIVVKPSITNAVNGSLMMTYYLRPNELVTKDKVSTITNINNVTGEITVNQIPLTFDVNKKYDIIQSKSPFVCLSINISPTSLNTTTKTITFDPDELPDDLQVGDYINLECETFVPQIPSDLHVVLAHRVAARCLEALGDSEGLQNANQKLSEMELNTSTLIDNRVEDAPRKIKNRHGTLRNGLSRRSWRFGGS